MINNGIYDLEFKQCISKDLNSCFITNIDYMDELTRFLVNPPISASFFQDFNKWIKNIIVFPFKINYNETPSNYLTIGKTTTGTPENPGTGAVTTAIKGNTLNSANLFYNLGEIYVDRKFNDFRDYNGFTNIKVFLPFLGFIDLDCNECIGKYVRFRLSINCLDGSATYIVCVNTNPQTNNNVIYPFDSTLIDIDSKIVFAQDFQLGYTLPLSNTNAGEVKRNILLNMLSTAGSIAITAATGFPTFLPSTTSSKVVTSHQTPSLVTGRMKTRYKDVTEQTSTYTPGGASPEMYTKAYANKCFDGAMSALENSFVRLSCNGGGSPTQLLNCGRDIEMYIYTPKYSTMGSNEQYLKLYGKPLGKTKYLNSVHGYTEISAIHIEGQEFEKATSNEIAMLNELLSSGVILP